MSFAINASNWGATAGEFNRQANASHKDVFKEGVEIGLKGGKLVQMIGGAFAEGSLKDDLGDASKKQPTKLPADAGGAASTPSGSVEPERSDGAFDNRPKTMTAEDWDSVLKISSPNS